MCGILGCVGEVFPVKDCEKALEKIQHRGKDHSGIYVNNDIILAHNRLSIIDLDKRSNQPFISSDKNNVLVYNGEIYNFKLLKKEFDIITQTSSDTEVLLKLLQTQDVSILSQLNGMFAFGLYNKLDNSIVIARDPVGIKPLFYFYDGQYFAFASEIKALTKLPYIAKNLRIKTQSIGYYFRIGFIPEPYTIFENIYKFPAGNYGIFKNNTLKILQYQTPISYIKKDWKLNFDNTLETLQRLLEDSVKLRMISDVPIGTLLSGGIDSSLITAIAQKHNSLPINTFSIGFNSSKHNEAYYAKEIANYLGTNHHEYIVSEDEAVQMLSSIISTYDEPYADSSAFPTMIVFHLASNLVKVTLSGDGGDELFGGYGSYIWQKRLSKIPGIFHKPVSLLLSRGNDREKRVSPMFDNKNIIDLHSHIFSVEQYFFTTNELLSIAPNLTIDNIAKGIISSYKGYSLLETQMLFDFNIYLKDDLLVKIDRASMAYTVENRTPLLDKRIIELAFSLPEHYKIYKNKQKHILKELLALYLPRNLFERPKQGFSIPLSDWLKNKWKFLIDDFLDKEIINQAGWIDYKETEKLKKRFLQGDNYLYNKLWNLAILHYWYYNYKHNINNERHNTSN